MAATRRRCIAAPLTRPRPPQEYTTRKEFLQRLFANTGMGYLGATVVGAAWGTGEALRGAQNLPTTKLRTNLLMNRVGARGRQLGIGMGVLAYLYSMWDYAIEEARDGDVDDLGAVAAAGLAGASYRALSGRREALRFGLLGVAGMSALITGEWGWRAYARRQTRANRSSQRQVQV